MKKITIILSLILSHLGFSQSLPISGDQFHLYGPNSSWGQYLKVGGNGRGTTNASVVSTDGNLHLDSKDGKALYLNHYSLGNTYLNTQGGNVGIGTTNPLSKLHVFNGDNSYGTILANATESSFSLYTKTLTTQVYAEAFRLGLKYGNDENNGFISFYRGPDGSGGYLGFSTNGLERIRINADGNVGIGTAVTTSKLDVNGAILARNGGVNNSTTGTQFLMGYDGNSTYKHAIKTRHHGGQDAKNAIDFYVWDFGTDAVSDEPTKLVMTIDGANTGNVGIGTTDTKGFKLGVQGKIAAEEVKVAMYNNWADFVFENNYKLPTLKEVEQYIKDKGHLKDIPSAEDVKQNGIFLGEMDSKLLQKIEELTLYTIEQQKEIENQKAINENLIEKLKTQDTRLENIETMLNSKKQ